MQTDACFSSADALLEIKVFNIYEMLLAQRLNSFDTTLEQDLVTIQSPNSIRHYFAVIHK